MLLLSFLICAIKPCSANSCNCSTDENQSSNYPRLLEKFFILSEKHEKLQEEFVNLNEKNEKLQGKYVKVKGNRDGLLDELLSANNELYELKKAYEALLKSHSMLNKSYNALNTRCGHDANLLEIRTRRLDLCLNKTEDLQRINQSLQEKTALADEQMELYQKCNKEYNDYKSFLIGVAPMVFQEEKTALAAEQMKLYQTCKNEFSAYKNLTNSFFAILTGFSTFSVFLGFWIARKFPNFLAEEKKQP